MSAPRDRRRRFVLAALLLSAAGVGYCTARPAFVSRRRLATALQVRGGSVVAPEMPHSFDTVPASWVLEESQQEQEELPIEANNHADEIYGYHQSEREQEADPQQVVENPFQPPSITVSEMALAIRWTAEVNRRLHVGTADSEQRLNLPHSEQQHFQCLSNVDHLRGGAGAVATAPVASHRIPLTRAAENPASFSETIFHAKALRSDHHRGAARWGPDLEQFLGRVVDVLTPPADEPTDPGLERALAMIYLDRACSVETSRSNVPQVPFATPRTAHRLVLTSMLVAVSAVRGIADMSGVYRKVEAAFGISAHNCHHMVEWMRAALGDENIFVTPEDVREWRLLWEARFAPAP